MKNFNIYDPMKRGEGLMLDGQTLAHIEVSIQAFTIIILFNIDINLPGLSK